MVLYCGNITTKFYFQGIYVVQYFKTIENVLFANIKLMFHWHTHNMDENNEVVVIKSRNTNIFNAKQILILIYLISMKKLFT